MAHRGRRMIQKCNLLIFHDGPTTKLMALWKIFLFPTSGTLQLRRGIPFAGLSSGYSDQKDADDQQHAQKKRE